MPHVVITRSMFAEDRQGRTFTDVLNDPAKLFDQVLAFLNVPDRQRRMEESELHHDRPPLAGVVRELESQPAIDRFLASQNPSRTKRLRQAVGVVVRMIMERRGWMKTGKKGSLGVRVGQRSTKTSRSTRNTGGLARWFLRAERYTLPGGMPFHSPHIHGNSMDSRSVCKAARKSRVTTKRLIDTSRRIRGKHGAGQARSGARRR